MYYWEGLNDVGEQVSSCPDFLYFLQSEWICDLALSLILNRVDDYLYFRGFGGNNICIDVVGSIVGTTGEGMIENGVGVAVSSNDIVE